MKTSNINNLYIAVIDLVPAREYIHTNRPELILVICLPIGSNQGGSVSLAREIIRWPIEVQYAVGIAQPHWVLGALKELEIMPIY